MRVIFAIEWQSSLSSSKWLQAIVLEQKWNNLVRCFCSDCHLCPALVRYGHLGPIVSRVALPLPRMCLCHHFLPLQFCYPGKIRASIGTQSFPCLKFQTNTVWYQLFHAPHNSLLAVIFFLWLMGGGKQVLQKSWVWGVPDNGILVPKRYLGIIVVLFLLWDLFKGFLS